MRIIFALIFILLIAVTSCLVYWNQIKKSKSEIIKIEQIEMIVLRKNRDVGSSDAHITYSVVLEGVLDKYKKTNLYGKQSYYRCNEGDTIRMQEVIYKYKNKIFSEICFAGESEFNRLLNYKESLKGKDVSKELSDKDIEEAVYNYHCKTKGKNEKLMFIVFVIFFILISIVICSKSCINN